MSTIADPAALADMAAGAAEWARRRDARAAAAGAASPSSLSPLPPPPPPPPGRYARRTPVARDALPLDLLLHPRPNFPSGLEASPASCARARRDLWAAPGREAALMAQAALFPLAVWAYGAAVSSGDSMARWQWDRYWPSVPRVRLPQLRSGKHGVIAGSRTVFFNEADEFLRSSSRWIGRLPPWMRPKPPGGAPGAPRPPVPPPKDY